MNRRCRVAASIALATGQLGAATSCGREPAPATVAHHGTESDTLVVQGRVVDTLPATSTTATIPPTTATTEEPTTTTTEPAPVVTTAVTAPVTTAVTAPVTTRRTTTTEARPVVSGRCGGDLPPCWVMEKESGGDPTAVSPKSYCGGRGCYGKWQYDPLTWDGYGGYANAHLAPESVQDDKARLDWDGGAGCAHWAACG